VKEFTTDKIRNVCLAGQRGCGKTSLADAIAFNAGINNRIGRVDEGSSLLDHTDTEIAKKTTISAKLLATPWGDGKINWLDCPGHPDFVGELLACRAAAEAAVMVINATSGVEVGTQMQWRALADLPATRVFFVNKMDMENVTWQNNLSNLTETFGNSVVPVQLPIGEGQGFKGIVDLIANKAYSFGDDGRPKEIDIPAELKDAALSGHEKLIEVAAEGDDALMEKFFEDGTLSAADFAVGFKKTLLSGVAYPILVGSASKNMGVSLLLDFVYNYAPSPAEAPTRPVVKSGADKTSEIALDPTGQPLAYVFKTVAESHLGDMSYVKVYSGTFKSGLDLSNQQTRTGERVTQMYTLQGKSREELSSIPPGDIGVLVKLRDTHIGNTLASSSLGLSVPEVIFPNPVMDVAIKAKSKGDEEKISSGLHKLHEEDPTFKLVSDPALGQQVLYGQGPTHIEVLTDKLKSRFGVEVELVRPKIPYRETVRGKSEKQYRHKKQSGGRGQFGDVYLRMEPLPRGGGFEFVDAIKGGVIPGKFIPAVEKGVVEAMQRGGLAGSQVVDVRVTLYFGSYHEVDSSDMAFKIAGSMAFKECFMEAKPVLLEPIVNIEVTVPEEYTGDVMGDLSSRRGRIAGMDPDGRNQIVKAAVPQAELYQYAVDLRSMTQGQGVYALEFARYEEVPHDTAQKVIEAAKQHKEQEG